MDYRYQEVQALTRDAIALLEQALRMQQAMADDQQRAEHDARYINPTEE